MSNRVSNRKTIATDVQQRRAALQSRQNCRFIEAEEFVGMIVSPRHLVRADDSAANVRGVLDRATGTRYLTEEEKLFAPCS